jgi:subtilisin family serine protease
VASMSLGGGYSKAMNNAVKAVVNAGMAVVVAAGNDSVSFSSCTHYSYAYST